MNDAVKILWPAGPWQRQADTSTYKKSRGDHRWQVRPYLGAWILEYRRHYSLPYWEECARYPGGDAGLAEARKAGCTLAAAVAPEPKSEGPAAPLLGR